MPLTDLPEELLCIIFDYTTRGARKNLRLTSKLFERLASPLMWDRIWISSHPLDLDVFKWVTQSRFAGNIRELVWDDTTFQRPLMDWDNFLRISEEGHSSRRGANYPVSYDAYEKWYDTALAHHEIRAMRLDQQALTDALPKLRGLKRVILTNRHVESIPHEDEVPEFGSSPTVRQWKEWPERVPFPPSVCWYNDTSDALSNVHELFDLDYLDDGLPELDFRGALENACPFRGLFILLHALNEERVRSGRSGVQEFIIRPSYEPGTEFGPGISYLFFARLGTPMIQMTRLFEGLRVLNLVISNGSPRAMVTRVIGRRHLAHVLRAARSLVDLTLEMDYLNILKASPSFEDVGALDSKYRYEHLKRVTFVNGWFDVNSLMLFLRNHRDVLKDVHLYKCSLVFDSILRKTWRTILGDLRNQNLHYNTFIIEDCEVAHLYYNNASYSWNGEMRLDAREHEWEEERFRYYDRYY
ncbi:MAG: hypothetical protein M1821_000349 [Bathelium mastoideum]|nr:MAG: hypothetical protein M1821_000349 [Bathelium mastoideum]